MAAQHSCSLFLSSPLFSRANCFIRPLCAHVHSILIPLRRRCGQRAGSKRPKASSPSVPPSSSVHSSSSCRAPPLPSSLRLPALAHSPPDAFRQGTRAWKSEATRRPSPRLLVLATRQPVGACPFPSAPLQSPLSSAQLSSARIQSIPLTQTTLHVLPLSHFFTCPCVPCDASLPLLPPPSSRPPFSPPLLASADCRRRDRGPKGTAFRQQRTDLHAQTWRTVQLRIAHQPRKGALSPSKTNRLSRRAVAVSSPFRRRPSAGRRAN